MPALKWKRNEVENGSRGNGSRGKRIKGKTVQGEMD
jgi:hypothetical protein